MARAAAKEAKIQEQQTNKDIKVAARAAEKARFAALSPEERQRVKATKAEATRLQKEAKQQTEAAELAAAMHRLHGNESTVSV